MRIHRISISPPLTNTACAWSSDLRQLTQLYESPHTGAITTRTATIEGFTENSTHTSAFARGSISSINSYGYSPHPLAQYIEWARALFDAHPSSVKPVIISIAAPEPMILLSCLDIIQSFRRELGDDISGISRVAVEINLSCPNIPSHPPPAYVPSLLAPLLGTLSNVTASDSSLTVGLKLPPYTYSTQFEDVVTVLREYPGCVKFLTCTNTLGNTLLFGDQLCDGETGWIDETLGGSAGDALHPLALGNVLSFSRLLSSSSSFADDHDDQRSIAAREPLDVKIIGVGGVTSAAAASRMFRAGASIVGCATFLGIRGVDAFSELKVSE